MKKIFSKVMSLSAAAVLMLMSSAAIFADEGEVEYTYITADSEAQLLLDMAALETTYIVKGKEDGKVYDVSWTAIETIKTDEKVKDGEAVTVPFGPYNTKEAAEAAINKDKSDDSASTYQEVTYSDIKKNAKPAGQGTEMTYESEVEYDSIEKCQAAISAKTAELEGEGYTDVKASEPVVSSSTIESIECTSQNKLDRALRYEINKCDYIIVKQATWFVIWTVEDMSAFADEICEYAKKNDKSLNSSEYLGMWHGYGTFSTNEHTSGTYKFEKNGSGGIVLEVSAADKISHMDYGTFDVKTSDKYSFKIKYTVPAPIEYEYSFTKTVQKYKEEYKYRAGYRVKVSEIPDDPPSNPSDSTTATGTEATTTPSSTEASTEVNGSSSASTAATDGTTEATEKTEPTWEFSTEESGTTVNESESSGSTAEGEKTTENQSTEVIEESGSGTLVYDSSSDNPTDPSKTNPLVYDPTASAGENGNADKSARTGDNINVGAIAAILVLSGLGAAGALIYRRKKA